AEAVQGGVKSDAARVVAPAVWEASPAQPSECVPAPHPAAVSAPTPAPAPAPTPAPMPVPEARVASLPESVPQAGFGHAEDYSWLTGELQYIRARNVWRLRYSPPDQEDRHGGAVVLVTDGLPSGCQSGQIVRVEGQLVNPESDEARPPYWVRSLQVLKPAPALSEE